MSNGNAEPVRANMLLFINSMFDELPRTRVGALSQEAPAFRTCGVAGFYVAVVVLFGAGLITGRSLPVLAIVVLVSALSFFAYTYLRRWITGVEQLVLLEHVWFALAANAGVLWLMHQPVLSYLDVIGVALCPFLTGGRIGCTLVGCCHGKPSSIGICYREASASDGFARHLVGVRLFPVATIEAVGLLIIGLTGLLALPFASSGKVFAWYLLSYSVMRFALEGLRGDERPHWLGLSQARWMSIIELMVAVHVSSDINFREHVGVDVVLLLTLVSTLVYAQRRDARRLLLTPAHVAELQHAFADTSEMVTFRDLVTPAMHRTSRGTSIAVSPTDTVSALGAFAHVSISLPPSTRDLRLLVDLAMEAFPDLVVKQAALTRGHLLHVQVPISAHRHDSTPMDRRWRADALYGMLVLHAQHEGTSIGGDNRIFDAPDAISILTDDNAPLNSHAGVTDRENGNGHNRERYFAGVGLLSR